MRHVQHRPHQTMSDTEVLGVSLFQLSCYVPSTAALRASSWENLALPLAQWLGSDPSPSLSSASSKSSRYPPFSMASCNLQQRTEQSEEPPNATRCSPFLVILVMICMHRSFLNSQFLIVVSHFNETKMKQSLKQCKLFTGAKIKGKYLSTGYQISHKLKHCFNYKS